VSYANRRTNCFTCGSQEPDRRYRVGEDDEPCQDIFHADPRDTANQHGEGGPVIERRDF
jgi:hypothetical protein